LKEIFLFLFINQPPADAVYPNAVSKIYFKKEAGSGSLEGLRDS